MSPKVERGISYCPEVFHKLVIRTKEDKGYFSVLSRLLDPRQPMFWDDWNEVRGVQTEGAALVAPLSILFWEDE